MLKRHQHRTRANDDDRTVTQAVPRRCAAYTSRRRMSFNACSHNRSGLRSPALARSMILAAMACLTKSSEPSVRRAMQVISNATPKMRLVSGFEPCPVEKGADRHCSRPRALRTHSVAGSMDFGTELEPQVG